MGRGWISKSSSLTLDSLQYCAKLFFIQTNYGLAQLSWHSKPWTVGSQSFYFLWIIGPRYTGLCICQVHPTLPASVPLLMLLLLITYFLVISNSPNSACNSSAKTNTHSMMSYRFSQNSSHLSVYSIFLFTSLPSSFLLTASAQEIFVNTVNFFPTRNCQSFFYPLNKYLLVIQLWLWQATSSSFYFSL